MSEKTIVLTLYGKGEDVHVSVSLFGSKGSGASNYCENINSLELAKGEWVYAGTVEENQKIEVVKTNNMKLDALLSLEDRDVQRVLAELDKPDLAMALKDIKDDIKDKIFENMSKKAVEMLKEDIECIRPKSIADIRAAQQKIEDVIRRLDHNGSIRLGSIDMNMEEELIV